MSSPWKSLGILLFKGVWRILLVFSSIYGAYEIYNSIFSQPDLTFLLESTVEKPKWYESKCVLINGTIPIAENSIVVQPTIKFSGPIDSVNLNPSNEHFKLESIGHVLEIKSKLINPHEKIEFTIYTKERPMVLLLSSRIEGVESYHFYDFEFKPKPFDRIMSFWLVLLVLSVFLFLQAIVVIHKDSELGILKHYIYKQPLTSKNIKKYIKGYKKHYKTYRVRIKPPPRFMGKVIRWLFKHFPNQTEMDIWAIRVAINKLTDLFTLYRIRTAFIVIGFISFLASISGFLLNYFYYEIEMLSKNLSLDLLNKILLTLILLFTLVVIIFPRQAMNIFLIKRSSSVRF